MIAQRERRSLLVSLGAASAILRISAPAVVEAARGVLTNAIIDRRMRWLGETVRRYSGTRLLVEGLHHAEGPETFVMMSNHESLFDVPMIYQAIPRTIRMVTKKELFRVPIWGRALREAGFFEMDRNDRERAIATLKTAEKVLQSGVNVWISPEGRRPKHPGGLGPFKKGGFMLALAASTRILPIGLSGTREILPPGAARTKTNQTIALVVGPPIDVTGKDRDTLIRETRTTIESLVERARELRTTAPAMAIPPRSG